MNFIFGPVPSRRLGQSLGIDPIPLKTCNWNCVYCQLGRSVCGPVGDCNTVQQSAYARLFGILPLGVLGLIGYIAIIAAWWIERRGHAPLNRLAALALVIMTLNGTLFSIYFTFLEPFVIGATCAWCLTSAILMTALLWLTVTPQRVALIKHGSTN